MQMNYEHCLPVKQDNINAKRSAIIFRHGNTTPVSLDTGIPLVSEATESSQIIADQRATAPKLSTQFGHLDGAIREGKKLYTKDMLVEIGAHRYVSFFQFYTRIQSYSFLLKKQGFSTQT